MNPKSIAFLRDYSNWLKALRGAIALNDTAAQAPDAIDWACEQIERKDADAAIGRLVREKLVSGNDILVERCVIRATEVAAIDAHLPTSAWRNKMSAPVSHAVSAEADLETGKWTFDMEPGCRVFSGRCAIVPADEFARLQAQRDAAVLVPSEALKALQAQRDELLEVAEAIELALRLPGVTAAEVLDENSPIRDGLRAAIANAKATKEPT